MKNRFILGLILTVSILYAGDVSITVYNQNRALVKEVRSINLGRGISEVSFTDVASRIDPTSVHFKSLTAADKVQILEQNFEYDLVGGSKILSKYVDEDIRLVSEKGELFQGKLLSAIRDIVIQNKTGGIIILNKDQIQHFDLPKLPEGLITRPTLVWQVNNRGPETHKAKISYLTSGMNWHAEYVALVNEDDTALDLSGWVSIDNQSGATYQDAKLKLVAGDVNIMPPKRGYDQASVDDLELLYAPEEEPQFEEKAFFEYHLYTLQRKSTLKDNQTKQIALFPSATTKTDIIYQLDHNQYRNKIRVNLEFKNSKKEGLGMPLPKGMVRIYKADTDGSLEFIGEDRIDHTSKDEKIRLFVGNVFDITAERSVMDSRNITQRSRQESVEIVLRNHKADAVEIQVIERFGTNWQITQSSQKYVKKEAYTAEFDVQVPSDGETVLSYTVLTKW